jgi:hypothetical protein
MEKGSLKHKHRLFLLTGETKQQQKDSQSSFVDITIFKTPMNQM